MISSMDHRSRAVKPAMEFMEMPLVDNKIIRSTTTFLELVTKGRLLKNVQTDVKTRQKDPT